LLDELASFRFVYCEGNARVPDREKLGLLQFEPLPWRITEHDIESSFFENLGKLYRPMEKVTFLRKLDGAQDQSVVYLVASEGLPDSQ